ncbi:hypothetical protein BN1708_006340 [Verticillium longisporum]|uniref:Uncharacterized protein n=1 Tax=Verticillium longisporum TaxID=100787 RepID=A0A0G4MJC6_VERLO|nr:hypothetical protein BN1708_006340 [Verticillium longisporum]
MSTSNHSQWPPKRPSKRNKLRNGTVIIPGTGERSHRQFTLRNPSLDNDRSDDPDGYRSLLLSETNSERAHTIGHNVKTSFLKFWDFLRSPAGKGVLKCTLAYLLGSMATYLEPISDFLGKPDGKHVVATITVYFHANRTWGSMVESVLIAFCAIGYAQIISMLSMGLSVLGNEVGFQVLSHVMILIICIGFGLGFVGWIKQRMNSPLVNVGCTLASIAIITIVTKEEAVQGGYLSSIKVVQVFKILVMGGRNGGVIVDGGSSELKEILKTMEGNMTGGKIIAGGKGLSRQNSMLEPGRDAEMASHTRLGLRPNQALTREDSQQSFGMSSLEVEEEENDETVNDARKWLKVIGAYDQPRLCYNVAKKHFERYVRLAL